MDELKNLLKILNFVLLDVKNHEDYYILDYVLDTEKLNYRFIVLENLVIIDVYCKNTNTNIHEFNYRIERAVEYLKKEFKSELIHIKRKKIINVLLKWI